MEELLLCTDVDLTLWSSGGPVGRDLLDLVERQGGHVVIVSPSEAYPRDAAGRSAYPRQIEFQALGRSRSADLVVARAKHPTASRFLYIDDLDSGRRHARDAEFEFANALEFACANAPTGPIPRSLRLSFWYGDGGPLPIAADMAWSQIEDQFARFAERGPRPGVATDGMEIPLWNASDYDPDGRGHRHEPASPVDIRSISAVVYDGAGIQPQVIHDRLSARNLAHILHTTQDHTRLAPRTRTIVPLVAPIPLADWNHVVSAAAWIVAGIDPPSAVLDPGRWYWTPVRPRSEEPTYRVGGGDALDWRRLPRTAPLETEPDPVPRPVTVRPPYVEPPEPEEVREARRWNTEVLR